MVFFKNLTQIIVHFPQIVHILKDVTFVEEWNIFIL